MPSYGEERKLQDLDVLWNSTGLGTLGRLALYEEKLNPYKIAVADSHVTVIRTNRQYLNPRYLYVYLRSNSVQSVIEAQADGSTNQKELKINTVKNYRVPIPPLAEQERIVSLLIKADLLLYELGVHQKVLQEKIETTQAKVLDLAIHAILVEQRPEEKLSEEVLSLPEVEGPFEIPANWKWCRFEDVIVGHLGGGTPSKSNPEYWGGDIPWASVKDLKGDYLEQTQDHITKQGLENSSSNLIPAGTLVICTRMALGKIVKTVCDVAINQDLRAIFLNTAMVTDDYFCKFYKTVNFNGQGTTVKGINLKTLLSQKIPLPPLAEQHRICEAIEALQDKGSKLTALLK